MKERNAPFVLLVNPWIHDFAAYDFWARPLGLLYLAAILRRHKLRVGYLDCLDRFHPAAAPADPYARCGRGPYHKTPLARPAALAHLPRRYSRYGIEPGWLQQDLARMPAPDLVMVTSMMTYWYPGVRETIRHLRDRFPHSPVVLGGIYASLCPQHALDCCGVDQVVGGPGEPQILALVAEYTGADIEACFDPTDLDSIPYPALDLQRCIPFVPILTSRGCPYDCAYCASGFLEPRRRVRDPVAVLEEMRYWHARYGVRDFVFYDDALLVDAPRLAFPLFEGICRRGLKLRLHTPNAVHVREISPRMARLMMRAGFKTLRLGLETAAFGERERLDRKVTAKEFARAAENLRAAGFKKEQVGAYLLAGLPGQSREEILRSIETVRQSGITPVIAHYTPIPHTALWPAAVRASRYDLAADPLFCNNAIAPCQPEEFSWETLSALKQRAAR